MSNLGKRYIAVWPAAGGGEGIQASRRGAESMYTKPGMARRYAGKNGRVLEVDLDALPEVKNGD